MSKKCSKCKEIKSYNEFYNHHTSPDGLQYQCITCCAENGRIYRERLADESSNYRKIYKRALKETPLPHPLYLHRYTFFLIATGLEKLIQNSNSRKRELKEYNDYLSGINVDEVKKIKSPMNFMNRFNQIAGVCN